MLSTKGAVIPMRETVIRCLVKPYRDWTANPVFFFHSAQRSPGRRRPCLFYSQQVLAAGTAASNSNMSALIGSRQLKCNKDMHPRYSWTSAVFFFLSDFKMMLFFFYHWYFQISKNRMASQLLSPLVTATECCL